MSEHIEIRESNSVDGFFAVEIVRKELVKDGHLEGLKSSFEMALKVAAIKKTFIKYKGRKYIPCVEITDSSQCRTITEDNVRVAEQIAVGIFAENTGTPGEIKGEPGDANWRVVSEWMCDKDDVVLIKLVKKEVKK